MFQLSKIVMPDFTDAVYEPGYLMPIISPTVENISSWDITDILAQFTDEEITAEYLRRSPLGKALE